MDPSTSSRDVIYYCIDVLYLFREGLVSDWGFCPFGRVHS